ncbi:hypothetical protein L085_05320 [Serratia sp. FS14]|nr:hypothetical protein L085_05320 [Serratia sp. FS14]
MVTAGLGGEPHLVQRLLAVDDNFGAVFEAQRHHAAIGFVIDVRIAVKIVQCLFNIQHQLVGQLVKLAVVHIQFLLLFMIHLRL